MIFGMHSTTASCALNWGPGRASTSNRACGHSSMSLKHQRTIEGNTNRGESMKHIRESKTIRLLQGAVYAALVYASLHLAVGYFNWRFDETLPVSDIALLMPFAILLALGLIDVFE